MWTIQNYTPFAVGGSFVCDREGQKLWALAVRATFMIADNGQLVRARTQPPVSRSAKYAGDVTKSSLLFDTDFPFAKSATDVIVTASAWAPGGRPTTSVDAAFQVGTLRKQLRVYGERAWVRAGPGALVPTRPKPFVSMPIRYERSFGGEDPEAGVRWQLNPAGCGFASNHAKLVHARVPNVEDPRAPLIDSAHRPREAAGFGALAPHWAQRQRFVGTYDARWKRERAPLWPEDFDARFFQVAPHDQQVVGFLRGGEPCVLLNMTPSSNLRFVLPRVRIYSNTVFSDREERRDAQLHTVLIEPDEQRLTMVWHAALPCHDREHLLQHSSIKWEGERTWVESPVSTSTA